MHALEIKRLSNESQAPKCRQLGSATAWSQSVPRQEHSAQESNKVWTRTNNPSQVANMSEQQEHEGHLHYTQEHQHNKKQHIRGRIRTTTAISTWQASMWLASAIISSFGCLKQESLPRPECHQFGKHIVACVNAHPCAHCCATSSCSYMSCV